MTSISRNSPCPCGSGKRYKHCCGANQSSSPPVLKQSPTQVYDLLNQALRLQEEGREEAAAVHYESVLKIDANNPNAHNMLAVIREEQWRMVEALRHAHLAGELTGWRDPFFTNNYIVIVREILRNVDRSRYRQTLKRYEEELFRPSKLTAPKVNISVLIFEQASTTELKRCLGGLAKQHQLPFEVLVGSDFPEDINSNNYPFPIRAIPQLSGDEAERANNLANEAKGEFLIALRIGDTLLPEHLYRLAFNLGTTERWIFASSVEPVVKAPSRFIIDVPTTGFSLISLKDQVVTESNLLVSLKLHKRIGGFNPIGSLMLLDYCLRLLWEAEPLSIPNETCLPGSRKNLDIENRMAVFNAYFQKAFSNQKPPNVYAPSKHCWGFRLHLRVAIEEIFVGIPFMKSMNREIEQAIAEKEALPLSPQQGVNLIGFVRGEFGLGENMRSIAHACLSGNISCSILDPDIDLGTRQNDDTFDEYFSEEARHNCSVFFFNPDVKFYKRPLDSIVFERSSINFKHTKIGFWFWELEKVSDEWKYAIDKIDEIWVATEFVADAMRRVTDKPVIKIPTPISFEIKGKYDRKYFGLPSNTFIFLFSFDFNGFPERKNPYALIRAFQNAFPVNRKDVALVLKCVNGHRQVNALKEMLLRVKGDGRIIVKNEFLSRDEVYGLQSVVDAYVSLHRSEGLGLGLAECMYQGKPVIGTGYSGNLEFMNEANSGLVNYSIIPVRKGDYLYDDPGFYWADPDEKHASYLMTKLVDDVTYRQRIAAQGQEDIRRKFNYVIAAEKIRTRLKEIGAL